MRKVRHRGLEKFSGVFTFAAAAYHLVRIRMLLANSVGVAGVWGEVYPHAAIRAAARGMRLLDGRPDRVCVYISGQPRGESCSETTFFRGLLDTDAPGYNRCRLRAEANGGPADG
jgi:hypothetical protein